nr:uncharacterized protein LOC128685517 isoform X2 [Cherax quadricarinatus]
MVRTWQIILLLLTAKMASSGLTRERRAFSANSQHIYSPSLGSYSLGNPLYKACTERPTIANAQVRCLVRCVNSRVRQSVTLSREVSLISGIIYMKMMGMS